MTTPHICISTAHLVTVPVGMVGLATVDSTAHFLEAGRHLINHQRMTFLGFKQSTDELINAGSKYRILVPAGKIGLAWNHGESKSRRRSLRHRRCIDRAAYGRPT